MDIDFHYYATYVAARFAGYPAPHALVIATAAQMIDENGRHVLIDANTGKTTGLTGMPDDFEIRADPQGPALHTYRVQMTFQGIGDIGTSSNDTVASIWPVYHFLPGNFDPERSLGSSVQASATVRSVVRSGPAVFRSARWTKRTYSAGTPAADVARKFRWLCRPHSPLAVGLVNNATDMVHDESSVVSQHALELYLVGVTMHVFIDTWAHQDFVGPASRAINGVSGTPSIGFLAAGHRPLPSLADTTDPATVSPVTLTASEWKETAQGFNWLIGHGLTDSGTEEKNIYVGHGQVGHWPDHSSLVWQYKPNWSKDKVTRANPIVYFDAFVHMIWAMYCIRNNLQYVPFDATPANVGTLCTTLGITPGRLSAVYSLFTEKRSPWGSKDDPEVPGAIKDIWDRDIYAFGLRWQAAIRDDFGFDAEPVPSSWLPGKSAWVMDALAAYQANQALVKADKARKGQWFSVSQFTTLPFFRFNLAAKCHYRFVKQQLLAFGETLLGEWADGAAYADDLTLANSAHAGWLVDVLSSLATLQRRTELRALSEGMAVLTSELMNLLDTDWHELAQLRAVLGKLRDVVAAVDSEARYTYGIRDGASNEITSRVRGIAGADALTEIKKLIAKLAALEAPFLVGVPTAPPVPGAPPSVVLLSFTEWKSATSAFGFRDSDAQLTYLDAAYRYLMEWLGGARTLRADDTQAIQRAKMVAESCDDWLEAHSSASSRREVIARLKTDLSRCLDWAAL